MQWRGPFLLQCPSIKDDTAREFQVASIPGRVNAPRMHQGIRGYGVRGLHFDTPVDCVPTLLDKQGNAARIVRRVLTRDY